MLRSLRPLSFLARTALLSLLWVAGGCATTQGAFELAVAGQSDLVELTHPLVTRMPPAADGITFQMAPTRTIERDGQALNRFAMSEGSGTNIEAPSRLVTGSTSVDKLALSLLMGYGVVIDVTASVEKEPGYRVTRSDLEKWESDYGPMPGGSIVLIRTGWSSRWETPEKYLNLNADGNPVYPGISGEAVEFLVRERRIHALGIDTPSLYAGSGNETGQKAFLVSGKYHINNLANLDRLPASGSFIVATPLRLQGGTGSPARVIATMPQKKTTVEPGKKKVESDTDANGQMGGSGAGGGMY